MIKRILVLALAAFSVSCTTKPVENKQDPSFASMLQERQLAYQNFLKSKSNNKRSVASQKPETVDFYTHKVWDTNCSIDNIKGKEKDIDWTECSTLMVKSFEVKMNNVNYFAQVVYKSFILPLKVRPANEVYGVITVSFAEIQKDGQLSDNRKSIMLANGVIGKEDGHYGMVKNADNTTSDFDTAISQLDDVSLTSNGTQVTVNIISKSVEARRKYVLTPIFDGETGALFQFKGTLTKVR